MKGARLIRQHRGKNGNINKLYVVIVCDDDVPTCDSLWTGSTFNTKPQAFEECDAEGSPSFVIEIDL